MPSCLWRSRCTQAKQKSGLASRVRSGAGCGRSSDGNARQRQRSAARERTIRQARSGEATVLRVPRNECSSARRRRYRTSSKLRHARARGLGCCSLGMAGELLRLTCRVRCRTSIVMTGLFEPPPGREVGELSARPLGFYAVSLAKRCYLIALRYTENKGYSKSSILISPLIPRLDLVWRYNYIYIYSNACLEMSALVCRVPTLFLCRF
jgi:hypothetical protein